MSYLVCRLTMMGDTTKLVLIFTISVLLSAKINKSSPRAQTTYYQEPDLYNKIVSLFYILICLSIVNWGKVIDICVQALSFNAVLLYQLC